MPDFAGGVPLDTGHLHQTGHRITGQTKQTFHGQGTGMADFLAVAALQIAERTGGHGTGGADFRLTSALCPCNAGTGGDYLTNSGCNIKRLNQMLFRNLTAGGVA